MDEGSGNIDEDTRYKMCFITLIDDIFFTSLNHYSILCLWTGFFAYKQVNNYPVWPCKKKKIGNKVSQKIERERGGGLTFYEKAYNAESIIIECSFTLGHWVLPVNQTRISVESKVDRKISFNTDISCLLLCTLKVTPHLNRVPTTLHNPVTTQPNQVTTHMQLR